jgi:hypothetical protein
MDRKDIVPIIPGTFLPLFLPHIPLQFERDKLIEHDVV